MTNPVYHDPAAFLVVCYIMDGDKLPVGQLTEFPVGIGLAVTVVGINR